MMRVKLFLPLTLIFCSWSGSAVEAGPQKPGSYTQTLFAQSAARILQEEVRNDDVSYLLLDSHTGDVIATNWSDLHKPVPLGSLIKPFTALAYGQRHGFDYPKHVCRGSADGCWLPRGHGALNVTGAIAQSCNSYFRQLTKDMTSADITPAAERFRFNPPSDLEKGEALAGLGNAWRIAPIDLAHAYIELIQRRADPGVAEITDGLRQSAKFGTGAAVGASLSHTDALVKTGTAACTHTHHAPGDGFVVALVPSDDPKILLLVREHGVPGATAARVAGELLHRIIE
jgi:cell division protein FtsI/penicillin-binding protein 2